MKRKIADDKLDELLYQYMPLAEEKWMETLERRAAEEEYIPSEEFQKKEKFLIEKGNCIEKRRKRIGLVKRIAAVFFVMISVSFAVCMSVDATREDFIRFTKKLHSDWTEYRYDLEEGTETEFELIEPTYLPEGYREYDREDMGDLIHIYYQNEKGVNEEIIYEESTAEGLTVGLDTEGADIKTKEICGENVEYFENKGMGYVYWTDADTYYNIIGYVDVDELLKMADSVISNEKYKENKKFNKKCHKQPSGFVYIVKTKKEGYYYVEKNCCCSINGRDGGSGKYKCCRC